jgi:hypothetical protein
VHHLITAAEEHDRIVESPSRGGWDRSSAGWPHYRRAEAGLTQAQITLARTRIVAPESGRATKISAAVGAIEAVFECTRAQPRLSLAAPTGVMPDLIRSLFARHRLQTERVWRPTEGRF